jgi:hypothetical protein
MIKSTLFVVVVAVVVVSVPPAGGRRGFRPPCLILKFREKKSKKFQKINFETQSVVVC